MRRLGRDRSGVAAVEFAVIAGGFLLLLLGGLQAGLMLSTQNTLQFVASMTARCAALSTCTPASYAVSLANDLAGTGVVKSSDVTVATGSTCQTAGGSYSNFTMVTITSELWSDRAIDSVLGMQLKAFACYPSPS